MPGKFDSERDALLHRMTLDGWANDSDGDVGSATGYFSMVSTTAAELFEVSQAFEDDAPEGFEWPSIVGHYLMREDSQGFVTVTEYPSWPALDAAFRALFSAFHSDIDY